jgi:hypothetical protein
MILFCFGVGELSPKMGSRARARHADLDSSTSGGEGVKLSELVAGSCEADVEAVDFTEPALVVGFGYAVDEVVVDLDQSGPLGRVGS